MKRLLLILTTTGLLTFSSFSQGITLTFSNSGFTPGFTSTTFNADTNGILPGVAGSNVVWDFSHLFVHTIPTSINYIDPKYTVYTFSFKSATVAYSTGNKNYSYFKINDTENTFLGDVYEDLKTIYSDHQTMLTYPFKYGDEMKDSFFCNTAGLANGLISGITYVKADGWGTIKLPNNTYNNVLRLNYTITEKDSSFEMDYDVLTQRYVWYDGIHKTPILEILERQMLLSGNPVPLHSKNIYVADFTNGIANDIALKSDFKLFPNPACRNTDLSYDLTQESVVEITINSLYGELIKSVKSGTETTGHHIENIPLTDFQSGIYFIQLKVNGLGRSQKLIIE